MSEKGTGKEEAVVLQQGDTPRSTWPWGGDHVMKATEKMPEDQRKALRWLFFHSIENGIRLSDAADRVGYSTTTLSRAYRGEYEASLDSLVGAIGSYQKICEQRAGVQAAKFVETATARKIWQMCEMAVTYNTIVKIYGDSQIGKTWALEEYARRHNHGQTRYVRLPAAAGIQMLIRGFARACGLSPRSSFEQLRDRVVAATDEDTLWLIDELHQVFTTYQKRACLACLEIVREIHDRTHCGMVLCGTHTAREEIEKGQHAALLQQLDRRGIFTVPLPKYATWSDRNEIARHFGLGAPEGNARQVVDHIVRASGLKAYTTYLQAACKVAAKRKVAVTWSHFEQAYATVADLSGAGGERE